MIAMNRVLPHTSRCGRILPLAVCLAAFSLTSCTRLTPQAFNARMAGFIGHSEADLVARLGGPMRTYEVEGRRFLQYEDRRIVTYPGDVLYGPSYGGIGYGGGGWRRFGPAFGG